MSGTEDRAREIRAGYKIEVGKKKWVMNRRIKKNKDVLTMKLAFLCKEQAMSNRQYTDTHVGVLQWFGPSIG